MPRLVALSRRPSDAAALHRVAVALGQALQLEVVHDTLPEAPEEELEAVLRATEAPGVVMAVLPSYKGGASGAVPDVLLRCQKPLVLVPMGAPPRRTRGLRRVLVPLDGTEEAAAGISGTLALFAESGLDLVVLHVFEEGHVPRFWDQAVHEQESWESEFLARFCPGPSARLELRSGRPWARILDVADREHADLIALGWTQPAAGGRGRTVWATVAGAHVPVMLLPRADVPAPDTQAGVPAVLS